MKPGNQTAGETSFSLPALPGRGILRRVWRYFRKKRGRRAARSSFLPVALSLLAGLLLLTGASLSLRAEEPAGKEVIRKVDLIIRGRQSSHMTLSMKVHRPRWDRELSMEGWESRPMDAMFIRILSPPGDAGTAFLKKGNAMRQYVPRINRTIRISKSMMLTSWMGSDFSNDDLVRSSSMVDDYVHTEPRTVECDAKPGCWEIELKARENAPVVWPRIVAVIRKDYVPLSYTYYNLRDEPLKRMLFDDIHPVQGRLFPFHWVMENLKQTEHRTEMTVRKIEFDRGVSRAVFTERNLTRGK